MLTVWINNRGKFGGGGGQNFWNFTSPHTVCCIAFLRKNFRKFLKFIVSCPAIFSKNSTKLPWNLRKFSQLFQNRKTVIFLTKLVQNYYIDQNLAKFSHKTPKTSFFSLKPSVFQNFRRLWYQIFGVLCPKNPILFGVRVPLIYLWYVTFGTNQKFASIQILENLVENGLFDQKIEFFVNN